MRVTKGAIVAVALVYVFLWVIALHGASNLVPMLAVPLILAILVAVGVWIQRFVGVQPRQQHFAERADDPGVVATPTETTATPPAPEAVDDRADSAE